jgi:hypothetical protein
MTRKSVHDMGGDPAGPVDHHEHTPSLTERRIDATMMLLRNKPRGFWATDEMRRTIESLAPETYRASSYYEKWTYAMRDLLIEKGVLTEAEITARLAEVKARHAPKTAAKGKRKAPAAKAAKPSTSKTKART